MVMLKKVTVAAPPIDGARPLKTVVPVIVKVPAPDHTDPEPVTVTVLPPSVNAPAFERRAVENVVLLARLIDPLAPVILVVPVVPMPGLTVTVLPAAGVSVPLVTVKLPARTVPARVAISPLAGRLKVSVLKVTVVPGGRW